VVRCLAGYWIPRYVLCGSRAAVTRGLARIGGEGIVIEPLLRAAA
jgi:hypothetical protein